MEINSDVRARIVEAIEQLTAETGKFPTVDLVRKRSMTNMSDASAVVRELRRQQRVAAASPTVEVPNRLQNITNAALIEIWTHAQQLARESAQTAQREHEAEKAVWDQVSIEMGDANKALTAENAALQERVLAAEAQTAALAADVQQQKVDAERQLASLAEQARTNVARAEEIEKRAGDLKAALVEALESKKGLQAEFDAIRKRLDQAAEELVAVKVGNDAQRAAQTEQARRLKVAEDQAATRSEALSAAREEAAHLRGQCDALRTQHAALLQKFQPSKPEKLPAKARKK